ncbi:MAG: FtsX-like permease family protein [Cyclobacteriaceae bacterium]|nr:FtsX-like permease family protein [Cyclobacteriaceae bacterium]
MDLPFFIARRYFLSKRKKNFINVISILSMVGVAFTTAALVIVLSVFNGLGVLLNSLNQSFDPELKISLVKGKSFELTDELLARIENTPGVKIVTPVIEDYVYVRYRNADMVVTMKGVGKNFLEQHRLDDHIVDGELKLTKDSIPFAIIGNGVQYMLSASLNDDMHALQVFYIKNLKSQSLNPLSMYARKSIRPGAVFSIEKTYNENYMFVPLAFAESLMDYGNKRTSLEVQTDGKNPREVQAALQQALGENFTVLNNEEQHKELYLLVKFEKLFSFLALSILLLVGSINIFFSLMMLAIDKKKDISVLTALGAPASLIKRIFLTEGALIAFTGAGIGLVLGAVLCFLQDQVGLVSMGMENAVISHYPVKMQVSDFLLTGLVIVAVTFIISIRPASLAARSYSIDHL